MSYSEAAQVETECCNKDDPLPTGFIASRILESEISATKKPKLITQQQLHKCPHCDKLLAEKTYKRHKKLFCKNDNSWIKISHSSNIEILEGIYIYIYIYIYTVYIAI